MSLTSCCTKGFEWDGKPEGKVIPFPNKDAEAYIAGSNTDRAVLLITDIFGWAYPNNRLLADHIAKEAEATVYVPDFFHGDILPSEPLEEGRLDDVGLPAWLERNSRKVREPEILESAKQLRSKYKKVGAIGYCYGGWAVFRLGSKDNDGLVDCISTGHPSLLEHDDIDNVRAPTQILAPEIDFAFTTELKGYTWKSLQKTGVILDYQHYPGVEHSCFVRGSPKVDKERAAMARGKNAVIAWLTEWLHDHE